MVQTDRRSAHYADALVLARHILEATGRSLPKGLKPVWTFLIHTPAVVEAGLTYVYVYPTHRLDKIYGEFISPTMRRALENVLPLKEYLELIYAVFYPDHLRDHWAPGDDHRKGGDILHDSVRYTRHWIGTVMDAGSVMRIVQSFRRLNGILPTWFYDPALNTLAGKAVQGVSLPRKRNSPP